MLTNCNALSASRLKTAGAEFKKHTQVLIEMKKDLDYIFKKIRVIKGKLNAQYPQAFAEAVRSSLAEEADENDDDETNAPSSSNNSIKRENAELYENLQAEEGTCCFPVKKLKTILHIKKNTL